VQDEHETNAIYCKMSHHETRAKDFATYNRIEFFSELIKLHSFTSALWLITLMWNVFFPWCSHKPKER